MCFSSWKISANKKVSVLTLNIKCVIYPLYLLRGDFVVTEHLISKNKNNE